MSTYQTAAPSRWRRTSRNAGPTQDPLWLRWTTRWGLVIVLIACWQWISGVAGSIFFPTPVEIVQRMGKLWFSGSPSTLFLTELIKVDVLTSLGRAMGGWVIACVVGIALGLCIGQWPKVAAYVDPPVNYMRSLPKPAIIPIFLLVLGATDTMRVGFIAFGCLWPILLNTIQGVRSVDPLYREAARAYKISRLTTIFKVVLPAALPKIAAGMRIALSLALILMVLSELTFSENGLGHFLIESQRSYQTVNLWAAIVLLGLIGYGLNVGFVALEHKLLGWHRAQSAIH